MLDYFKLLLNLEENIFHLIQKRHHQIKIGAKDSENSFKNKYLPETQIKINSESKSKSKSKTKTIYSKDNLLKSLNIELKSSSEIIDVYIEKFTQNVPTDIDILNLIVKYIEICGKILKQELYDTFGVREINYTPSNTIKYLSHDYIIKRYSGNYAWGITNEMIGDMRYIFFNIIIPFSEKHMFSIYNI